MGRLARDRYRYSRCWAPVLIEPVELLRFVIGQYMPRGIRGRAERCACE
jgi:hypothetical protein